MVATSAGRRALATVTVRLPSAALRQRKREEQVLALRIRSIWRRGSMVMTGSHRFWQRICNDSVRLTEADIGQGFPFVDERPQAAGEKE